MRLAIVALLCTTAFGAAANGRVVRATTAEASKRIYKGRCPVQLLFVGTITSARAGEFTYGWKRSDGAMGPLRSVQATRRGETWRVHEVWELSDSTRGWAQLWIASERRGSQAAHFRVECK
jgi:hypothetical protein